MSLLRWCRATKSPGTSAKESILGGSATLQTSRSCVEAYEHATPSLDLACIYLAACGMYGRPVADAAKLAAALCAGQIALGCAGHPPLPADRTTRAGRRHKRPLGHRDPRRTGDRRLRH